jgi:hypothetical protein
LPEAVENHHHLNGGPLRRRLRRPSEETSRVLGR